MMRLTCGLGSASKVGRGSTGDVCAKARWNPYLAHYGLRRVNTKEHAAAQKAMVLSAVAYNLKKLLKYQSTRVRSVALACQADHQQLLQRVFWMLFGRWLAL